MPTNEVALVDYDASWPKQFEAEKGTILLVLSGGSVTIEHIGSTSIPGLSAKPVIDIAVGVEKLSQADSLIKSLERIGYEYVPKANFPSRRFLRKGEWGRGTHHLHVYERSSEEWMNNLLFRDYLRDHPNMLRQYASLKVELAERYSHDRAAYTSAKAPFIQTVIEAARLQQSKEA